MGFLLYIKIINQWINTINMALFPYHFYWNMMAKGESDPKSPYKIQSVLCLSSKYFWKRGAGCFDSLHAKSSMYTASWDQAYFPIHLLHALIWGKQCPYVEYYYVCVWYLPRILTTIFRDFETWAPLISLLLKSLLCQRKKVKVEGLKWVCYRFHEFLRFVL